MFNYNKLINKFKDMKEVRKKIMKFLVNPVLMPILIIFFTAGIWQVVAQVEPIHTTDYKELQAITKDIEKLDSGKVDNLNIYGLETLNTDSGNFKVQKIKYDFVKDSNRVSVDRYVKVKRGFNSYHYNGLLK